MRKEREDQEKKTEVWIERTDGVGNKFWVNEATKETLLEHPVAKAKRELMHHAAQARMADPVRRALTSCSASHHHHHHSGVSSRKSVTHLARTVLFPPLLPSELGSTHRRRGPSCSTGCRGACDEATGGWPRVQSSEPPQARACQDQRPVEAGSAPQQGATARVCPVFGVILGCVPAAPGG